MVALWLFDLMAFLQAGKIFLPLQLPDSVDDLDEFQRFTTPTLTQKEITIRHDN